MACKYINICKYQSAWCKSNTVAIKCEYKPVPVVHARWEISSDGYYPYCKKCNARPENGKMTKYCPNCGAKMDGD